MKAEDIEINQMIQSLHIKPEPISEKSQIGELYQCQNSKLFSNNCQRLLKNPPSDQSQSRGGSRAMRLSRSISTAGMTL